MSGKFELATGGAASGIEVRLLTLDGNEAATGMTDADGAFGFNDLPPSPYELRAEPAGFLGVSRVAAVSIGKTNDMGVIKLYALKSSPESGRVDGKVIVEGNGDPNGAQVTFFSEATTQKVATVAVGLSGEFSQQLPPGIYTATATHPWFANATRTGISIGEAAVLDLTASPLQLGINPAKVTGRILKEVDLSATGVAAAGVQITSDTNSTATTDANGNFSLDGLPAGTRTIRLVLTGFHDAPVERTVRLGPGETQALPDIRLLLDRGDVTGVVEMADGTELRDVTVSVGGVPYSAPVSPSTAMPAQGRFLITGVPIGTYAITAARANYIAASSAPLAITFGGVLDAGTLKLTRIQGDFQIEDADPSNTPGFASAPAVTLRLQNVVNAAEFRVAEGNPTLAGVTFAPFVSSTIPFTLPTGDGLKTVYLQFKDAANNLSGVLSANVVLDTTAPTNPLVVIEDGKAFTRNNTDLLLRLTATDPKAPSVNQVSGIGAVRISASPTLDASGKLIAGPIPYVADTSFSRPTTGDGVQAVYVQFSDNAGNVSAVASSSIVVDRQPPSGSVTIPRGVKATRDGYTNQALVGLTVTAAAEPNGGYVTLRLVNENAADLTGAVLQPVRSNVAWFLDPVEGLKTLHYELVDAAGNTAGQQNTTITLDTTPPATTAALVGSSPTNQASVTLALTATDLNLLSPTQGLTVSEDPFFQAAGTLAPSAFPSSNQAVFPLSALDGAKQVYVRARDSAGNDGIATVQLTLDRTAPTGSISLQGTLADGTASSTHTTTASVTVFVSQFGATRILLGDETLVACPSTGYSALTGDTLTNQVLTGAVSPRQLRACLADDAGNTTGPLQALITLDAAAPTGCTAGLAGQKVDGTAAPSGKTALRDVGVAITGCVETPTEIFITEAAVSCTATSTFAWQPYLPALGYSLQGGDGLTTVRGCVRDAARNTGPLTAATMTLDTQPPSPTPLLSIDTGATYVNAEQVTSRGGNIASVLGTTSGASEWALSETNPPTGFVAFSGAAQDFTFGGAGVRTVWAIFRDDVGNATAAVSDSIEFDVTAPTGSIALTGTLADGTASSSRTAVALVTVTVTQAGATEIFLGNESTVTCPATGYQALTGSTLTNVALTGSADPRVVTACLRDAAGNTTGPVSATIILDTVAPTGCFLTLSGLKKDGVTAAPAGKTALRNITAAVAGCVDAPVELYLTQSPASCTANASFPWQPFAASNGYSLDGDDGPLTVRGCARDAAGNVAPLSAASITLDTTPPTLTPTLTLDDGAAYLNLATFQSRGNVNQTQATGVAAGATEWALGEDVTPSTFVAFTSPTTSAFTFSAGDGTRTLNAIFRDDVGNATPMASDSIVIDTAAPAPLTISLQPPSGSTSNYSPAALVSVHVNAVPVGYDATSMEVVEHLGGGGCVAGDFATALPVAFAPLSAFSLTTGDGLKTVCTRFFDPAGNATPASSDDITVDATPPSQPAISNANGLILSVVNGFNFSVTLSAPVIEANLLRYEAFGDFTGTWVTVTPSGAPLSFTTRLRNDGSEAGFLNRIHVRAIDLAGNVSPEALLNVTADTNGPNDPTVNADWIDNGDGRARFYWVPNPASPDVVKYRIEYGPTPGNLLGTYALEGNSPIEVSPRNQFTLSGLPNGIPTFFVLRAIDAAGNVGNPVPSLASPLLLQPNEVSPTPISNLTIPGMGQIWRMVPYGNWLYVLGQAPTGCGETTLSNGLLSIVDLRQLESPTEGGVLRLTPSVPAVVAGPITVATGMNCISSGASPPGSPLDAVIDGSYLYVSGAGGAQIYDLADPIAPALIASIDMSPVSATWKAVGLGIVGTRLVLAGRETASTNYNTYTSVISLDKLYDLNPATSPTSADLVGTVTRNTGFWRAGSATLTRNRLIWQSSASDHSYVVNLSDALDDDGATSFDDADVSFTASPLYAGGNASVTRPAIGGNYLFSASNQRGFSIFKLGSVWSGASVGSFYLSTAFTGGGQLSVTGSEAYVPGNISHAVDIIDLSDDTNLRDVGRYALGAAPDITLTWGNYLIVAHGTNAIRFLQIAAPRAMTLKTSAVGVGNEAIVGSGLIYTGSGWVWDLFGKAVPSRMLPTFPPNSLCTTAVAVVDDLEVAAIGQGLKIRDLEKVVDGDLAINPGDPADVYNMATPAGTRITDIELLGNYVVAAEVRTTGVYLEVFSAANLRDRARAPSTTPMVYADRRDEFQVVAGAQPAGMMATITMTAGRVALALGDEGTAGSTGTNLIFVDLRPLLDDDPATVTDLDTIQGAVPGMPRTREAIIRGSWAYAVTDNGLFVFDVAAVMDNSASTKLVPPASPTRLLPTQSMESLAVYGSYALITPSFQSSGTGGVFAVDVSIPTAPVVSSFITLTAVDSTCFPPLDTGFRHQRRRISVAGSHAYYNDLGKLYVINLQ